MILKPPFVLAITGSSLSAGKLAGAPNLWHAQLEHDLRLQPEAVGRIIILRMGHGGWTSNDVLIEAPTLSNLRPTHVIADVDVNDCVVSGGVPVYTRAQKIKNVNAAAAVWKANNPGLDITLQTLNPVSSSGTSLRPNYGDYCADTIAMAATNGWTGLDNRSAFPNPLPDALAHQFDGLHGVWAACVERYAYRAILFLFRQKMAAFWGLSAPSAPVYPTDPDVQFMLIGGGGGGGDGVGGGGGNGDVIRGVDYGPNLVGAVAVGAAGVAASGQPGATGADTTMGRYRAKGGGGGGLYANNTTTSTGKDGGGGGGGAPGSSAGLHNGGNSIGQGFPGGACDPTGNGGAGAGSGCVTPPTSGSGVNGGLPGLGWQNDVPGDSQDVGGGGPGGSLSGARAAYGLGGGPTKFGGGGRGGGAGSGSGAGDNGGAGVGYVWYPGAARFTGGTITSSGGFTVHKFTTNGTLA